jgi:hypothetical protein
MFLKYGISTLMLFINISLSAQAPNWEWARGFGSTGSDNPHGIVCDINGNIYIIGNTQIPISFDSIILIGSQFISKFNKDGNVIWAKSVDSEHIWGAGALATDINKYVYITGSFVDTLIFGNDTLISASSLSDIFTAKFDSAGNAIWAKSAGGNDYDHGTNICSDINSNIYVTGTFESSSITFGSITLNNYMYNTSWHDIFLVKYDPQGNVIWANSIKAQYGVDVSNITTDNSQNILLTGFFTSPFIIIGSDTLLNTGQYDIYLAKYDSAGNVLWAKSYGGTGGGSNDFGEGITTDADCNIYLTGENQSDMIIFGNDTLTNDSVNNAGSFIAKYDSSGNILWAKFTSVSNKKTYISCISYNSQYIYIVGRFNSNTSIVFGNDTTLIDEGGFFIAKYDTAGNILWAKCNGGGGVRKYITIDYDNNIYCTGDFYSSQVVFGTDTVYNTYPNSEMITDIFLAKLSNSGAYIHETEQKNSITVYPNPSNSNFMISGLPASGQIQIINSMGQTVKKADIGSHAAMSFTLTESGIYFIRVITGNESVTKKVVVCRSE